MRKAPGQPTVADRSPFGETHHDRGFTGRDDGVLKSEGIVVIEPKGYRG